MEWEAIKPMRCKAGRLLKDSYQLTRLSWKSRYLQAYLTLVPRLLIKTTEMLPTWKRSHLISSEIFPLSHFSCLWFTHLWTKTSSYSQQFTTSRRLYGWWPSFGRSVDTIYLSALILAQLINPGVQARDSWMALQKMREHQGMVQLWVGLVVQPPMLRNNRNFILLIAIALINSVQIQGSHLNNLKYQIFWCYPTRLSF